MNTQIHSGRTILGFATRTKVLLLSVAVMLIASARPTAAQNRESTDRDRPIRLTSREVAGLVGPEREIYYTFLAGPGVVDFTLNVMKEEGNPHVAIQLFDSNAKTIGFDDGSQYQTVAAYGKNDEGVFRVNLSRRQAVLMRISTSIVSPGSRFRLRLSGAIDIAQPGSAPVTSPSPNGGTMRVEMKDGSTQDIDLSRVQRITIVP